MERENSGLVDKVVLLETANEAHEAIQHDQNVQQLARKVYEMTTDASIKKYL